MRRARGAAALRRAGPVTTGSRAAEGPGQARPGPAALPVMLLTGGVRGRESRTASLSPRRTTGESI